MKKLLKCLCIALILCFSITPVYARAGGGSSGGSSGSSGGSSSSSHPYHTRRNSSPIQRFADKIGFFVAVGGITVIVIYQKRYKAITMHKEVKKQLARYPSFNEKQTNQKVIDAYYNIQKAWANKDMEALKQYLTPSLYEQWETKLNWWEYEGIENKISRITLLKTMIVDVHEDYFWSYIEGKMHDQMIKNNEVISTNNNVFIEYWCFKIEDDQIYLDEIKQEDET